MVNVVVFFVVFMDIRSVVGIDHGVRNGIRAKLFPDPNSNFGSFEKGMFGGIVFSGH